MHHARSERARVLRRLAAALLIQLSILGEACGIRAWILPTPNPPQVSVVGHSRLVTWSLGWKHCAIVVWTSILLVLKCHLVSVCREPLRRRRKCRRIVLARLVEYHNYLLRRLYESLRVSGRYSKGMEGFGVTPAAIGESLDVERSLLATISGEKNFRSGRSSPDHHHLPLLHHPIHFTRPGSSSLKNFDHAVAKA